MISRTCERMKVFRELQGAEAVMQMSSWLATVALRGLRLTTLKTAPLYEG